MPLISVLIPTFNDLEGLIRIIEKIPLNLTSSGKIEVIISDDSSNSIIQDYVKKNIEGNSGFYYYRGSCLGATKNWNALLSKCSGEFIQFIHHDESPLDADFFNNLTSMPLLADENYFHSCYLKRDNYYRLHSTNQINRFFLNFYPKLLLSRNFIGSPSCVLIARKNIVPFDERLVWNVDIDWYLKIHKKGSFLFSGQKIVSHANENSITSIVKKDISKIKKYEDSIIGKKNILHLFLVALYSQVWLVQKLILYLVKRKNL